MNILVVGGAGYIGSHMVSMLLEQCHHVVTLDNLSTGYRDAVLGGDFIEASIADAGALRKVFASRRFDVVLHFASFIQVGESLTRPAMYYRNNLSNTLELLDAMVEANVSRFIFSSSAAIFGEPQYVPIDERHPRRPINPYGSTKNMVECVLGDYDRAYGLKSVCLRYFNAAGAHPSGLLGERHEPETHLIPLLLQAASGRRSSVQVFGRDYDTADGTCIRDYVHVSDLCQAHLLAIELLMNSQHSAAFNLGNGAGFSVQQVIRTVEQVTGRTLKLVDAPRREGDPARLVADSSLIRQHLGWSPTFPDLESIVAGAWRWEQRMSEHR